MMDAVPNSKQQSGLPLVVAGGWHRNTRYSRMPRPARAFYVCTATVLTPEIRNGRVPKKMRSITMRYGTVAASSRPMAAVVSWQVRFVMLLVIMMMLSCSRQMNNHNNHHTMVDGFSILWLAAARRGNLKRALDIDNDDWKNAATTKMGRGQLVTGVTLPTEVRIYSCLIYICTGI